MKKQDANRIAAYKCVAPDGTDFKTGTLDYVSALKAKTSIEVDDWDPPRKATTGDVCGKGIHVSPTARKTIQFANSTKRPWRWLEGYVLATDIIEQDEQKMRVWRFTPTREITLTDIFGPLGEKIKAAQAEVATWKDIPWLKPAKRITNEQIAELIGEWRDALKPWLKGKKLPTAIEVVNKRAVVDIAAAADAVAAAAAAAADAADADAAVAVAAAVADIAVSADDAADAAADIADAAAAADAVAAADIADAADAADAAAAAALKPWRLWWYIRPWHVLRRSFRWQVFMDGPNPSAPLIELYKLGCLPIGFRGGKFVVYVPEKKPARKKAKATA